MRSLVPKHRGSQLGLRGLSSTAARPMRRSAVTAKALYHNLGPKESGRAKAAQQSLQRVLELVQHGERDALVDYFATSNLTDTPTLKLASGCEVMVFEDVMERMLLRSPSRHFLDSYAIRHLILSSPVNTQVLSGLMLGPNKYVQRMSVTSSLGESCILTFTMAAAEPSSAPQPSPAEPGTAAATIAAASLPANETPDGVGSGGVSEPVWRLKGVRGEPQFGIGATQPTGPSPELSPEQIVEAHLAALQRKDVPAAFQFLSPGSKNIIGDVKKFTENVAKHRRYGSLLGHIAATSVRRCMARPTTYMEIVSVTSASGTRFVFCYILSQETQGSAAGCWSIDFIKVVDDPRLVAAVDTSCAAQRKQLDDE
ncbi:hypothetical protein Vretimale_1835 [Volvox reticuliferus]|uniref:Uncharacterized protein n=1 Tax=Volvox reticuliferus TaxID=1737510 RepID=A0A8J4FWI7_9CHLO|nr:hypothetical protein Vretifemale_17326 [Volvox reticuliferus]GIL95922.1 hypothetical protein Vretimale_1835 [Volvox reticuliferus]